MSYTNETVHFSIPLPLGSDLTTPMDYNTAAAAVDAALFEAQTNASQAATDASNAVDTANQAASDVGDLGGDLNTLTGRVTALEQSDVIQDNKIANLEIKVPTKFDSVGIADAYVNGLTYAVGDIVTYNGQRYVCNTAVTAAEPFDADKWTAKDIQAELDQINSALADVEHKISPIIDVRVTGNGVKTRGQLLDELHALIDESRLTFNAILNYRNEYYHAVAIDLHNHILRFGCVIKQSGGISVAGIEIKSSGSTQESSLIKDDNTIVHYDSTNDVIPNGVTIGLKY